MSQQKYAKRLDRSRSFGTYHPPDTGEPKGSLPPAFYNQDGYDFDHTGEIVEGRLTDEQKKRLAKKPSAAAANPKAPKAPKPPKPEGEGGEGGDGETEQHADGLNLEAWLRGEEDYDFGSVQKAIKERYHVHKTSKSEMILFLVEDQKLVEADVLSDQFKAVVA